MKGDFLPTLSFRDLIDLNVHARKWVLKEAGLRIHGTNRVLPLPEVPPDLGIWHAVTVHRDCHVSFESALYSVPFALVGKTLWLRAAPGVLAFKGQYGAARLAAACEWAIASLFEDDRPTFH